MKDETKVWLQFAEENLKSSKILLQSHLYNPSLQNTQQSVEKSLKAIFIENNIKLKRTHDILELVNLLSSHNIFVEITEEHCDFLNTIYLPSKYPVGSALPDFNPDETICRDAILIAANVFISVKKIIS